MPNAHTCEYLSFGDALFLYLERPGAPLNIASLATFEGEIATADFRKFVASKLPQIPRYMQRVVIPPLSMGMPHWEFAPDFKLSDHIREVQLKRGTVAELKTVTANVFSQCLDRSHPLWELMLIHGLKQGKTALIARVHHCLADGISGMELMNVLMDYSPKPPVLKSCKVRVPRTENHGLDGDVIEATMTSWFSTMERLLRAGSEVLTLVQRATGLSKENSEAADHPTQQPKLGRQGVTQLAAELGDLPKRLPFNVLCRGPQRYEWTQAPLSDFKAIREKSGTMINDVVLTVLTAAFRRYSELHGVNVRGRTLRIVVPVSTRRHHNDSNGLGNHITFAPFSAPMGVRNLKKLLRLVHDKMEFVKTAHVADFVSFAGTLLGAIPTTLQAVLAPMISELPISLCNTICTNVPGPKRPLYLLGHEMLSAHPYVPIGGEMGVNCAVLSYNGTVYFGFTGDVHAAPDLEKLPKFVDESVAELKHALGARSHRRKSNAATQEVSELSLPKLKKELSVSETKTEEPEQPPAAASFTSAA